MGTSLYLESLLHVHVGLGLAASQLSRFFLMFYSKTYMPDLFVSGSFMPPGHIGLLMYVCVCVCVCVRVCAHANYFYCVQYRCQCLSRVQLVV